MNGEPENDFMITQDGMLVMKGKIYVPNVDDMRKAIIKKADCSVYVMLPDSITKTALGNTWYAAVKNIVA